MTSPSWEPVDLIHEAVRYVCRRCNKEVASIRRNTDFICDNDIVWVLQAWTGGGKLYFFEEGDIPILHMKSGRVTDRRREYAGPTVTLEVGVRSSADLPSGSPGNEGVSPYCQRCSIVLKAITVETANKHLQLSLSRAPGAGTALKKYVNGHRP